MQTGSVYSCIGLLLMGCAVTGARAGSAAATRALRVGPQGDIERVDEIGAAITGEDYPRRDDPEWLAWVLLKDEGGSMEVFKRPVPEEWWPDLSVPPEERYPFRLPGESLPSVDTLTS
jgi:hypothetical protein